MLTFSPMQTTLSGVSAPPNGLRDSSFTKNKTRPLHRWVPWIAGFSADFVDDTIHTYLPEADSSSVIMDPFAGVGTTLVQAHLAGLNTVGFEINPYAALATELKVKASVLPRAELRVELARFERYSAKVDSEAFSRDPKSTPPSGFTGRTRLFSPKIERKVLYVQDFINGIENDDVRHLFRLALGSVMVSFSNYSYEPSLTRRVAVGKAEYPDYAVGCTVAGKVALMLDDIEQAQEHMALLGIKPESSVYPQSIFSAAECEPRRDFVDLLITSPPYLNNYHYPRNTRPQMHWLGFANGTGYKGARENESFGKFWQTVRDSEPIPLKFDMPELARIVVSVRRRNTEKGCYGGPGWANYIATYFNDTYRFCKTIYPLMKPNAACVIVLGNSIIQGIEVKTDQFFGNIGELAGFEFERTHVLRNKRTGSSIIQSSVRVEEAKAKTVLYESAIVLRKPS